AAAEPGAELADPVLRGLAKCVKPMKESFIVAKLEPDAVARRLDAQPPAADADPTADPDEATECEALDTRQAFLNLCQGNHYQFDRLRRAKHSSAMVLFHLHHPDAPRFLESCSNCTNEIFQGSQYHCETCQDYFLCEACHGKMGTQHPHALR
ncbi:unnamed protein product, partial [Heterosigma akashiwo]